MTDEESRFIRDFLEEKFGLGFHEDKKTKLEAKLTPRVSINNFSSFMEYYLYLKFNTNNKSEISRIAQLLTNNETYFMREVNQLEVFSSILKNIKMDKVNSGTNKIRILSAGCSSGEEPYTLAMLLFESGLFIGDWDINIIGIDIDEDAIEKALKGYYYNNSFRGIPSEYLKRFFLNNGDAYIIKDFIKKRVEFKVANLIDGAILSSFTNIDIIFCRNVIIYFSELSVEKLIDNFSKMFNPKGYLFLGHAESLIRFTNKFKLIKFPNGIVYQKEDRA